MFSRLFYYYLNSISIKKMFNKFGKDAYFWRSVLYLDRLIDEVYVNRILSIDIRI